MDTGSAVIGCQLKSQNKLNNKYENDFAEYSNNEDDSYPSSYGSNKKNNKYNYNGPSRKHTRYKPKRNNINERNENLTERKVRKRVKFASKVTTIKVECWKKYNLEQTADENINELLKISNSDSKNKGKRSGRDNITCTCIIF